MSRTPQKEAEHPTCGRVVLLSERDFKRIETHIAGLRLLLPVFGRCGV